MNIEELKQLYSSNPTAKALCDHMASRHNNQTETKLERIQVRLQADGHDVKRSELIATFRRFEQIGCGQYIEGRRGWPSRFVWAVGSVSACRAAIGEISTIEPEAQAIDQTPGDEATITHTYNLRADLKIELLLPMDLTPAEAERIATFVKTLPFEEYE
jgi:hypothetical protein